MTFTDLIDVSTLADRLQLALVLGGALCTAALVCYWRAMQDEWR